ncbi:MAG: bifunctional 5,10-methylenetetrahydrofolate dehydrogenase/5,10-methenyltetrahydrofolate cyclohydrolase [Patescibacteria group bacterium]|jgi:methylenetetrahydrofolate dehydrogenase (NADP+)/methenyltetrahydrofolate cyclohydrolase
MILKGKEVAEKIYKNLQKDIEELKSKGNCPTMAVVLVGEDPASLTYVKVKEKKVITLGIDFKLFHLPAIASQNQLEELLDDLNRNKYIHGIIVQLPLPTDFDKERVLKKIDPQKDIDGFSGDLLPPPTAQAILEILKFYKIELKNKKIVIVGRGFLVGEPLEKLLLGLGFRPEVCDSETKNLGEKVSRAEILISATGNPGLITPDMVNEKMVVIDAGTAEAGGKMAGDVDEACYEKVFAYSPVPGGVGPVTVACLIKNLVEAAKDMETE